MLPIGNILHVSAKCHRFLSSLSTAMESCNMSSTFSRARSVSLRAHAGGWAAAAIFVVGVSACSKNAPPMQAPQVTVAPAIERVVSDWDEFTGHFEAVNSVEVRPRVGGFVQRVAFTEGASVHQGDVLFVIDQRPYEAEVARAEAVLAQARTRNQLAGMEVERAKKLVNTQAISREELDARTSGQAEGDAAVRAAEAAVKIARLNLEWTVVRAPISGRVGRAEITPGNVVQAGPPSPTLLTTIVSLDPISVYFDTDEQAYLKYMRVPSSPTPIASSRPVCSRACVSSAASSTRPYWSRIRQSAPTRIASSCSCSRATTASNIARSSRVASLTVCAPWNRASSPVSALSSMD